MREVAAVEGIVTARRFKVTTIDDPTPAGIARYLTVYELSESAESVLAALRERQGSFTPRPQGLGNQITIESVQICLAMTGTLHG
jgi:hypothetical protein